MKKTPLKQAKKEFEVQEFNRIVKEYSDEHTKIESMTDGKDEYLLEKSKIEEIFRNEDVKHFPIIIKA